MARWTAVGDLFAWPAYAALSDSAARVWLALFVTTEARRYPPGLFGGGVAIIADAAHKPHHEVIHALGELRDHRLIERDEQRKIVRMTVLPDRSTRPANGNCLRMWWNAFQSLPECEVRDRYVPLLEWLCAPMTTNHLNVWTETWGTVTRTVPQVPDQVPPVQGSLFISTTPETHPATVPGTVVVDGRWSDQGSEIRAANPQPVDNLRVVSMVTVVDHAAPLTAAEREAGYEFRHIPSMAGLPPVERKVKKGSPAW